MMIDFLECGEEIVNPGFIAIILPLLGMLAYRCKGGRRAETNKT